MLSLYIMRFYSSIVPHLLEGSRLCPGNPGNWAAKKTELQVLPHCPSFYTPEGEETVDEAMKTDYRPNQFAWGFLAAQTVQRPPYTTQQWPVLMTWHRAAVDDAISLLYLSSKACLMICRCSKLEAPETLHDLESKTKQLNQLIDVDVITEQLSWEDLTGFSGLLLHW